MPALKAGEVSRQLTAADKFLTNVKTLPSFPKIEKQQFDKLRLMVADAKLDEEQCAKIAEIVLELKAFSLKTKESLLQCLADSCSEPKPAKKASKATGPSDTQDYSCLHRFLPRSVWKDMDGQVFERMHSLCRLAAKLGLWNPTEKTVGTLTVLVFWKEWQQVSLQAVEKYKTYQAYRLDIRAVLKEYQHEAVQELRLVELPKFFSELPDSRKKILGKECLEWI